MLRRIITVGPLGVLLSSTALGAVPANFRWQVSTDDGATWRAGAVHVPREQTSVLVNAVISWDAPTPPSFFAVSSFDVSWRAFSAGYSDTADMFASEPIRGGYQGSQQFAARRFAETLKVDDALDELPPGLGTGAITPLEPPPNFAIVRDTNPVIVFQFRINLDGTIGERELSAVFRSSIAAGRRVQIWVPDGVTWRAELTDCVFEPASVTVVPGPGGAGLTLGVVAMTIWRRHRQAGRSS